MTTEPETLTEADLVEYLEVLREHEIDGYRQEVVIGPYTAILLIGALQLAMRHPEVSDQTRAQLGALIDQFRPWFVGTPGEHIIDRGDDPEQDR